MASESVRFLNIRRSRMCECPIQFSRFGVEGTEWELTIADPRYGDDFGIVPGREDLVRRFEVWVGESFLDHAYAILTQ